MTINEIAEGSPVTLTVNVGGESVTLETKVAQDYKEPYKHAFCIGAEPVVRDGKVVSLGKHAVSASIKNIADNREYKYNIAFHGMSRDRTQLLLFTPEDVAPVEQRMAYRVACSYNAVVQIGNNKKTVDGYLHDISFSGVGMTFVSDEFKSEVEGAAVSASIFDNDEHIYKVSGTIVRAIEGFTEGRTLIGIQFDETPRAIAGLVASLQRKELRLRKKVEEKKPKKKVIKDKTMHEDT